MTTVDPSVRSSGSVASHDSSPSDWCILRDSIIESVITSPGSFLTTTDDVRNQPREFWEEKLRSAMWAVVEDRGQIIGIAAAKSPGDADDYALQEPACFIESVWIAPDIRRNGVGERLVTYLIEQKRLTGIRKFYLWVFEYNMAAIRLYKRMDFHQTDNPSNLPDIIEVQFCREFESDMISEDEQKSNEASRLQDLMDLGITYRTLVG